MSDVLTSRRDGTEAVGGGSVAVTRASRAWMSAAIPGLGQWVQGRPVAGSIQFLAVITYLAGAITLGGWKPALLAVLWNAWSCADAWRYDR